MTTRKTTALTRWTFIGKVTSLLFNMLSRLVIAFLPRSKHLLIPWLQSLFAAILEPKKIKSVIVSIVSPSVCHEVMGPDAMILVLWMLSCFKPAFSFFSSTFIKRLFSSSSLSIVGWYHLQMWGYWYFFLQSWFQLVRHPAWHFTWCSPHIWRRKWQPTPVSLPGKSHGQRSLPGELLQSMGSRRLGHDWTTNTYTYSAEKLNKQSDNIQPWRTPFPIWNCLLCHVQFSVLLLDLHTVFSEGR